MTRPEIVLIGPPFAGKTTIGGLLARELGIPQVSLDDVRWDYYREIGYRDELARELRQKGGFLSLVAYWSQFNAHAIERVLADHTGCVFDLGAGPIVFESDPLRERIRQALAPFDHVAVSYTHLDVYKRQQRNYRDFHLDHCYFHQHYYLSAP